MEKLNIDIVKNDTPKCVALEELQDVLKETGYFWLGHGTGTLENSDEIVNLIFKNGLRTKDNSLYYTTIGLDVQSLSNLKTRLHNWQHLFSQNIILLRLPIMFINCLGNIADLDGERYGAFYNEKKSPEGKIVYYLDPKFIVGAYNTQTGKILLNKYFEKNLSKSTLNTLKEKYKIVLERTNARFKREEKAFNSLHKSQNLKVENIAYNVNDVISDFEDDIDWEISPNDSHKRR